jgi:hypothetical protein
MIMPSIEALKYGLIGLAALSGFWAAAKFKVQGAAPTQAGARLVNRLMIFSIALVLLAGALALYDGQYLQGGRRAQIISRLDETIGAKLAVDNDMFSALDSYSKQTVDNMIRQLCRDVIELSRTSSADAPKCKALLDRPPPESPT